MMLELLNTSIVVLAQDHNPTILHPAFLEAQKIVPVDWELAQAPVCTPAFSVVKFANGITFTAASNQLVLTEEAPLGNPSEPKVPELAIEYVRKLPHVRYTAIGVNFLGCFLRKDSEQFLIRQFLKSGPWNNGNRHLMAVATQLTYELDDAVLRLGIGGGEVRREDKSKSAVLINGNFHSDVADEERMDALCKLIGRWVDRLSYFTGLSQEVLSVGERQ